MLPDKHAVPYGMFLWMHSVADDGSSKFLDLYTVLLSFSCIKVQITQRMQTSANANISGRIVFHVGVTYGTPLLAAASANKFHGGRVYWGDTGGHISWLNLETCSKVVEDGAIGQNTYDFLLVSCNTRIFTVSVPQSILCQNNLAERLRPLNESEGQSG